MSCFLNQLKEIYPFPKATFTDDYVIIRNVPDSDCYKSKIKCYFIHSGICGKASDIQMLPSGVCIAKKSCNCGCAKSRKETVTTKICDFCGCQLTFTKQAKINSPAQQKYDSCIYWCDKMALAGMTWCARFRTFPCQLACIGAVEVIKDGCHWCCANSEFYENCVKPFENIAQHIKPPCDPMWDSVCLIDGKT